MAQSGQINIAGFGEKERGGLFSIAKDVLSSWIAKPKEQSTLEWLGGELASQIGIDLEEANAIGQACMDGIGRFNANLADINAACKAGGTKESWLQKRVQETGGQTAAEKGEYLSAVNSALAVGNDLVQTALHSDGGTLAIQAGEALETAGEENANPQEWNKLTVRNVAMDLCQQAALSGIGGAALSAVTDLMGDFSDDTPLDTGIDIADEETGSETDNGIKAVAAGALKIASEKEICSFLTKKTPLAVISNIACWGIEAVRTAGRVFSGKLKVSQAVERMGRVSSAAIGDLCANGINASMFTAIPVVGPIIGATVGAAISSQAGQKISQAVYAGFQKIKPVAVAVAEGIHSTIKAVANTAKSVVNGVFSFVGKLFS